MSPGSMVRGTMILMQSWGNSGIHFNSSSSQHMNAQQVPQKKKNKIAIKQFKVSLKWLLIRFATSSSKLAFFMKYLKSSSNFSSLNSKVRGGLAKKWSLTFYLFSYISWSNGFLLSRPCLVDFLCKRLSMLFSRSTWPRVNSVGPFAKSVYYSWSCMLKLLSN